MRRLSLRDDRGATAVFVALTMTIVLAAAALVVDVGALEARRAQLQDAADAAALAIAQRCHESDATVAAGCAGSVTAVAPTLALDIAEVTVNDGEVLVEAVDFTPTTVRVDLVSTQNLFFGALLADAETDLHVSATARWSQPAIPLALAFDECALPPEDPDTIAFASTGVYSGVSSLLSSVLAIGSLTSGDVPGYLEGVLDCGTDVLAGGWLASANSQCGYDPNLLTYVGSTLDKLLPIEQCADILPTTIGKSVLVPVYDSSTIQLLGSVLGTATVDHYAEIVVTGYDFDGLLGLGDVTAYPSGRDPGCASSLTEFLGLPDSVQSIIDLLLALGGPTAAALDDLLEVALACQGIQGYVVDAHLTADEAAARLVGVALVA